MLTALHQGDLVYGIDLLKWGSNIVPFKIEATPSVGYIDIGSDAITAGTNIPGIARPNASPICNWNKYGRALGYDYIYVNDQIKSLAVGSISTYSDEEQAVFLQHHIYDVSDLQAVFTFDQVVEASLAYYELATRARGRRIAVATTYLQASVGTTSAKIVGSAVASLLALYAQQTDTKIIDYLDSSGAFSGAGFLESGIGSIITGVTLPQIRDEIRAYFVSGTKTDGTPYYAI